MILTKKQQKTFEALVSYTGTSCIETLYNHIQTILNDCYVGHLAILEEDYNISEKDIVSLENIL